MPQVREVLQPVQGQLRVALPPTPGVVLESLRDAACMLARQCGLQRERLRRRQLEASREQSYLARDEHPLVAYLIAGSGEVDAVRRGAVLASRVGRTVIA